MDKDIKEMVLFQKLISRNNNKSTNTTEILALLVFAFMVMIYFKHTEKQNEPATRFPSIIQEQSFKQPTIFFKNPEQFINYSR